MLNKPFLIVLVALLALVVSVGSAKPTVLAHGGGDTIHACVNKVGLVRVVGMDENCRKPETLIHLLKTENIHTPEGGVQEFHVAGGIHAPGGGFKAGNTTSYLDGVIVLSAPSRSLSIKTPGGTAIQGIELTHGTGTSWGIGIMGSSNSNPGAFTIETGGLTKLLVDDTNGNVGIGTTKPGEALQVMGTVDATHFTEGGGNTLTNNISGKAAALAADPDDCVVGEFAHAIAANGDLSCALPPPIPNDLTVENLTVNGGNFFQTSTSPTIAGSVRDSAQLGGTHSVYVSGKYAYVAASNSNRLTIVDVSDPSAPTIAGSVQNGLLFGARSVYVSGKYAYVAAFDADRLTIVDVSDPSAPTITGSVQDGRLNGAFSVYVSGKYAYVAAVNVSRLTIVDVSDPSAPTIAGSVQNGLLIRARSVYVSGKYAYVAAPNAARLTIVDVSDPSAPTIAGSAQDGRLDGAGSVYVSGKYAYVAASNSNRLTIVDVSDPSAPTIAGSVQDGRLGGIHSVYVSGKYAYVAASNSNRLTIVDVSDPSAPTIAGSTENGLLTGASSVYVSGKYAYVAAFNADRLTIVDISGIDAPAATIGDISASTIEVTDNVDVGNNLYVRNGVNVGPGGLLSDGEITTSTYIQLALTSGAPPEADCDNETEAGRMKFDSTSDLLYICSGASGWVEK